MHLFSFEYGCVDGYVTICHMYPYVTWLKRYSNGICFQPLQTTIFIYRSVVGLGWWFGFLRSPYERDCYFWAPTYSQTTNPKHPVTMSWTNNYIYNGGSIMLKPNFGVFRFYWARFKARIKEVDQYLAVPISCEQKHQDSFFLRQLN